MLNVVMVDETYTSDGGVAKKGGGFLGPLIHQIRRPMIDG